VKRIDELLPKSWAGWLVVVLLASVIAVAVKAGWDTERANHRWSKVYGCRANLRAIAAACQVYAADNDGAFPDKMERLTPKYLSKPEKLKCPGDKSHAATSYAIVPGLSAKTKEVRILLYETSGEHRHVGYTNGDVERFRGDSKEGIEATIRAEAAKQRRD
jgi:hypothetical protein